VAMAISVGTEYHQRNWLPGCDAGAFGRETAQSLRKVSWSLMTAILKLCAMQTARPRSKRLFVVFVWAILLSLASVSDAGAGAPPAPQQSGPPRPQLRRLCLRPPRHPHPIRMRRN
jgi:hypothetical protein